MVDDRQRVRAIQMCRSGPAAVNLAGKAAHMPGMPDAAVSARKRRRAWICLAAAGLAGFVGLSVIVWRVLTRTIPECDWSHKEVTQVEAVPLEDFIGVNTGGNHAICDGSMPDDLYIDDP